MEAFQWFVQAIGQKSKCPFLALPAYELRQTPAMEGRPNSFDGMSDE
ncbi:MAG: hypothetical protein IPP49_12980 [Saprospiraceae bacterium]|nr:hypothetical protein [Saprospiraceae bacterium]